MDNTLAVERRSIDVIPDSERHGSVRSLFTVWFSANMQITTVVTGALGVILGLPLPWAILALVVGNVVGAIFMALHSAQGPKLGIPQMIQSRAQFGFYGAILPLLLVVLMYVGFFAASAVLGGSALASWWHIGQTPATIIVAAICTVLAVYGYRLIHAYERWIALVSGLGFLYLTIRLFTKYSTGKDSVASVWHSGHPTFGTFLLVVTLAVTWQITYAPYVADYSRYLPRATPVRAAFWWTYAGTVIGTIWMMAFGSIVAAVAANSFDNGSTGFVVGLGNSGTHWLISIVIIGGVIAVNVLNLYGMFMCVTTTVTALRSFQVNGRVRLAFILVSAVVGTVIAIAATSNFLNSFQNFILFLAYFLIPWTAINLTDFYFVRKEKYDMDSIFRADGIYGTFNIRTIAAYVIAVLVEIPFMSTTFYTGPMVKHLGGGDISWIFGLIVAAGLYYLLMKPVVSQSGGSSAPAGKVAAR
jgi:nucleobase:cation symporter-1, NCS1 family